MQMIHLLFYGAGLFLRAAARQPLGPVCPLIGHPFPTPRDLPSNDGFRKATASLNATLDAAITTGKTMYGDWPYNESAIAVTLFSGSTDGLIHEYYYTPPSIVNSTIGTKRIDGDSIYRIASVSKLLTAYLLLIRDGEAHLNTPVTDLIPELSKASYTSQGGVLIDYTQVTVVDLMTHMSGLGDNLGYGWWPPAYLQNPAFPQLPANQYVHCDRIVPNGTFVGCNREEFIHGVGTTPSLFQPGHSPVYSNSGFGLLGLSLEAITGTSMRDLLEQDLVKALKLNGTSYTIPKPSKNDLVLPLRGSINISEWYQDFKAEGPAIGYYSSSNDMAAIGRAILTSSLVPKAITNRWLKPRTFTSSSGTAVAVGGPWEIFRYGSSDHMYYLYSKEGDLQTYHTMFVLVPDFNFGFTVLISGRRSISLPLASLIVDKMMPALQAAARNQAEENFAGTYRASGTNASVTFEVDSHPGIKIKEWISGGKDLLKILATDAYDTTLGHFDFRIFPNELYAGDKVGFTGSIEFLPLDHTPGVFSDPCQTWSGPGATTVGKVDIGSFVFDTDASTGKAKRVRSEAIRIDLERE